MDDILGSIENTEKAANISQFQDRVSSLFYYLNFTDDLATARHYLAIDILESLVSNEDQETIKTNINNRWVELKTP